MSLVFLLRAVALHFLVNFAVEAQLLLPFHRESIAPRATTADALYTDLPLAASSHVFIVNATVGTPGQPVSLVLSPSSPNTWVPKSDVMPCQTRYDPRIGFYSSDSNDGSNSACAWGTFASAKSSTFRTAEQLYIPFTVAYSDTVNVEGTNFTDTLALGNIKLEDFSMGVVQSTSHQQWIGMLGLGNDGSTNFPRFSKEYRPNFIDRLVSSGKIISPGYSIWLNDPEGTSGNLLLGAIDQSKYEGELVRFNANQPYDAFPSAFRVPLVAVSVDDSKGTKFTDSTVVTLSPADSFSYLPDNIVEGIMSAAGATWNETIKRATIPCNAGSKSTTNFAFQLEGSAGPILNARVSDMVVPQTISRWELNTKYLANLPPSVCLFGVQKYTAVAGAGGPQYILGSSLLRRTYMVFDAANKDVAIAPVRSKSTAAPAFANLQVGTIPFDKFGARIPMAKLYCTHADSCDANPSVGGTQATADGSTDGGSSSSGGSGKPNIAIIIGVVVPVAALMALVPAGYCFWWRKRRQREARRAACAEEKVVTDSETGSDCGYKISVSGGTVTHARRRSTPPELFLGAPGALPTITEEGDEGRKRLSVGLGGSPRCMSLGGTPISGVFSLDQSLGGSPRSGIFGPDAWKESPMSVVFPADARSGTGGSASSSEKSERSSKRGSWLGGLSLPLAGSK